ncbi:malate dehydrogenase [Nanoarchaeota archaeon]
MKKISVIGAGYVGSTTALKLAQDNLGDIVLVDREEGRPKGLALDIMQSLPLVGSSSKVTGTADPKDIKGSDIVIITAGKPRTPGMTREDLMRDNANIVKSIATYVKEQAPDCILIVVTNPLDIMTYLAKQITGFPKERVVGMAGILDSTRFRAFIGMELNTTVHEVSALVLGSHGDSMVPVPECSTVSGIPITKLMDKEAIDRLSERTRKGGGEIVGLLKTGSAYYAPAACIAEMVRAIVNDEKKILPCSALLEGEYDGKEVYIGVPVRLGSKGMEKIEVIDFESETKESLAKTIEAAKKNIETLKGLVEF